MTAVGCGTKEDKKISAQEIIDKAIENAGGSKFDNSEKTFTFRNKKYKGIHKGGKYSLERIVKDSLNSIHDKVSNAGLERFINDSLVKVPDSLLTRISDGVNSVHYFAYLPYGLNAPAVNKEFMGEAIIKDAPYYKIKVTFSQEGGGTDFEDEFMYWIHKEKFTVEYLAYKYAVNGGGIRFREAYNVRTINGLRFVDYKNYKTDVLSTPLTALDTLYNEGKLTLLSKIELEAITVE